MEDVVERLRVDVGCRTIGELAQDRERALAEIVRLRAELQKAKPGFTPGKGDPTVRSGMQKLQTLGNDPMRFVRSRDLRELLGVSSTTIWRMLRAGRLPKPVQLGIRTRAWRLMDLLQWQAQLSSAPDDMQPAMYAARRGRHR